MILYFADRQMRVLGHASTNLPKGFVISEDLKTEDVETGVATFSCYVGFTDETRAALEEMTDAGNYLLRSHGNENEFYTIIDTEIDTKNKEIYIYAEDVGLDLLNEIADEFEADASYNAEWYINKYIIDSGFEIGINEIPADSVRKLKWEGEETVTARLASIATQFGGYEISFSFDIKGLEITNKYVNIHKERGQDTGVQLRLNRDIDRIVTSKSVANLATAFVCEGGVPDNAEEPITLKGYKYDDGDFYVDDNGKLKSRKAVEKWSRYVWNKEPNQLSGYEGHIVRPYSYNTTDQKTLCSHAITELKKVCDMEINYKIDINKLPDGVMIGDRVNIIDDAGEMYISTRVLKLETSVVDQKYDATLGEHLIKTSGISQKVAALAEEFAKTSQSAARALTIATNAKVEATAAQEQATAAAQSASEANTAAEEAEKAASQASQSAATAEAKALAAEAAVDKVEASVESIQNSVEEAQAAADNAEKAAATAEAEAAKSATAASNAETKAGEAATAAEAAQSSASSAITKADTAIGTAGEAKTQAQSASDTAAAAKLDAEQAEKDVAAFGESLETYKATMEADYARKTDLTETEAHLQAQITANAGQISTTIQQVTIIDETANDAKEKAEAAQTQANAAQTQANAAKADAKSAQDAADAAALAASSAQSEADKAKAAADAAQGVADKAEADLEAAKADLATVSGRVDATEEEIAAAQEAVNAAQSAADTAKADAATAAQKATTAQNTANTAVTNAANAQSAADEAASKANAAQQTADEAKGDASAAQTKANEAATAAANAQATANTAKTNAANAQAKADQAATDAANAQKAADDADAKAAQAQSDLDTAKQNLANVTSRVDATEEEIAAAEAAVATAQAAADTAKANAATAQSTADTAKANASKAQTAADNAKTAADNAKKAADEAQAAADKAQADVNALEVRVVSAETSITQHADEILLRAKKTEVTQAIGDIKVGGRNYVLNSAGEVAIKNALQSFPLSEQGTAMLKNGYAAISFDVYTDEPGAGFDFYLRYIVDGAGKAVGTTVSGEITDTYTRHTAIIKTHDNELTQFAIRATTSCTASNKSQTATFYVKNIKVETGTKATDWTPAPEDVAEDIDTAQETANSAQETADGAVTSIRTAESLIRQLSDAISMLVTDENGTTLLEQTSEGWSFNMKSIQDNVESASEQLGTLTKDLGSTKTAVDVLNAAVADLGELAAYVKIGEYKYTDESGNQQTEPSIDLGGGGTGFKLKITNTRILFTDGSTELVSINSKDKSLDIGTARIKRELQIEDESMQASGIWVWKQRSNGNLGLTWKGVSI